MLRRLAPLLIALAVTQSAASEPVASDMDLRGVTAVRVAVSPLPVDALDCNLDGPVLRRELAQELEQETLSGDPGAQSVAIITVLTAHDAAQASCTSTIMLGVYKKASFFDDAVGWIRTGYVVMWQSAVHVTSPLDRHPAQARDALSMLAEAMLESWREANPQPAGSQ